MVVFLQKYKFKPGDDRLFVVVGVEAERETCPHHPAVQVNTSGGHNDGD